MRPTIEPSMLYLRRAYESLKRTPPDSPVAVKIIDVTGRQPLGIVSSALPSQFTTEDSIKYNVAVTIF